MYFYEIKNASCHCICHVQCTAYFVCGADAVCGTDLHGLPDGSVWSGGQEYDRPAYDHSGTHADVYLRFPDNLGLPFCPASVK